jgi:molybdate transport system substrate-binding protein
MMKALLKCAGRFWNGLLLAALLGGTACAGEARLIFAAASLAEALEAVTAGMDPAPRLSFGGSGTMARQIDQGAPADVVVLASPVWMDWLEARGRLVPGTRAEPFGNRLVLVGPPGAAALPALSEAALLERLGPEGRLAMGEHRAVPAGQYGAAWLEAQELWDALRPRLAETENVRAALALVTRAEAPLALVYASDLVAASGTATVVWDIPDDQQPDIRYSLAALTPEGRALAAALTGPDALATFARFGFTVRSGE